MSIFTDIGNAFQNFVGQYQPQNTIQVTYSYTPEQQSIYNPEDDTPPPPSSYFPESPITTYINNSGNGVSTAFPPPDDPIPWIQDPIDILLPPDRRQSRYTPPEDQPQSPIYNPLQEEYQQTYSNQTTTPSGNFLAGVGFDLGGVDISQVYVPGVNEAQAQMAQQTQSTSVIGGDQVSSFTPPRPERIISGGGKIIQDVIQYPVVERISGASDVLGGAINEWATNPLYGIQNPVEDITTNQFLYPSRTTLQQKYDYTKNVLSFSNAAGLAGDALTGAAETVVYGGFGGIGKFKERGDLSKSNDKIIADLNVLEAERDSLTEGKIDSSGIYIGSRSDELTAAITEVNTLTEGKINEDGYFVGTDAEWTKVDALQKKIKNINNEYKAEWSKIDAINKKIDKKSGKLEENEKILKELKSSEFGWAKEIASDVGDLDFSILPKDKSEQGYIRTKGKDDKYLYPQKSKWEETFGYGRELSQPDNLFGMSAPKVSDAYNVGKDWITGKYTEPQYSNNTELARQLAGKSEREAIDEGLLREYGSSVDNAFSGGLVSGYLETVNAQMLNTNQYGTTKLTEQQWLQRLTESQTRQRTGEREILGGTIAAVSATNPFGVVKIFGKQSTNVVTKAKQLTGYETSKEIAQYGAENIPVFAESESRFLPTYLQYGGQAALTKTASGGAGPWLGLDIAKQSVENPYEMYQSFANPEIFWDETLPAILGYMGGETAGTRIRGRMGESPMAWSDALRQLEKDIKNKKIDIVERGKYEQTIIPGSRKVVVERTKKLSQAESNALFEKEFIKNSKGQYTKAEMDYAISEIRQGKYPTIIKDAYRMIIKEAQGLVKLKPKIKETALRQIEWTGKYGRNLKNGVIRYSQGGGVGKTGVQPRFLAKVKQLLKRQDATTGGSVSQTAWKALKQFAGDLDVFVKNPAKAAKEMHALLVRLKAEKSVQVGFKVKKITIEGSKIFAEGFKGEQAKLIEYHFESPPWLTDIIPDLPTVKVETSATKITLRKSTLWNDLLGMEDVLSRTAFGFAEPALRTPKGDKIVTPREQYMRTIVGALEGRAGKDIPKLQQMREELYTQTTRQPVFSITSTKSQKTDVQPWSIRLRDPAKPEIVPKETTITRRATRLDILKEEQAIAREITKQQINKYRTEPYTKKYTPTTYKPHEYYKDYTYKKPYYDKEYYDKKYYDKYYNKQYYSPKYYGKSYYDDYYSTGYYDKGYYSKGYYDKYQPYKPPGKKIIIPGPDKQYDAVGNKLKKKKKKFFTRYSASLGGLLSGSKKKPKVITGVERRGSVKDYSKQIRRLTGL